MRKLFADMPLPFKLFVWSFVGLMILLVLGGCGSSDAMPNEAVIAESKVCTDNGMHPYYRRSTWDGAIIGIECTPLQNLKAKVEEFTLDDGTRCVVVTTTAPTSRRAGFSGLSCDWKD